MNEYSVGTALLALCNEGTVQFYYKQIPQTATFPCGVVDLIDQQDDYVFAGTAFNGWYQVKILTDRPYPYEAILMYEQIHDLVQDDVLLSTQIKFRRESIYNYKDDQNLWHVGGIYKYESWT